MSGIYRYTRILELFQPTKHEWTIQELSYALDTSASTLYRLVRELVNAGMLESTVDAHYRLGPLFIEYYRRLQLSDPLIKTGSVLLKPLISQIGVPCSAILARLYGEHVMCVAHVSSPEMKCQTSYEIGRPMPPYRGATSKAVLSTLSPKQVRAFMLQYPELTAQEQKDFEKLLIELRKNGVCETIGEVDDELIGISSPVHDSAQGVYASISIILHKEHVNMSNRAIFQALISTTAKILENILISNDMGK